MAASVARCGVSFPKKKGVEYHTSLIWLILLSLGKMTWDNALEVPKDNCTAIKISWSRCVGIARKWNWSSVFVSNEKPIKDTKRSNEETLSTISSLLLHKAL